MSTSLTTVSVEMWDEMQVEIDQLRAENAKLRTEGHWFDPHTLKPETQDDAFRSDFYGKLCGLIYEYQSIGMSPDFIMEVIGYTINQFAQYKIGFWDEETE